MQEEENEQGEGQVLEGGYQGTVQVPGARLQSARTAAHHHDRGPAMTPIDGGRIPIAEASVIWVMPSGERRPGRIAICAPEPDPCPEVDDRTTWACWWYLEGMWHRPCRTLGDGSLQPLMLALEMIGYELHAFMSRGGKALTPGEEEAGFSGVLGSFRLLMRPPGAKPPADPVLAELDAEIAMASDDHQATDDP
jgi:hypothetical protein